jgi:hypothetical protein
MTTTIDRAGLYSIAPPMPSGAFQWTVDSLLRSAAGTPEEKTTITLSAGPFRNNNGTPVAAGTVFHVSSVYSDSFDNGEVKQGTVLTADTDTGAAGTQIRVGSDGMIRFSVEYGPGAMAARFIGFSDVGTVYGNQIILLAAP